MRIRVLTSRVSAGERGQMAIAILLAIPLVFMFFALALDAGMWFFDHRRAQNQADAAALAAVQELPYASTAVARDAALDWLEKNGAARESVCDSDNSSDDWTFFDGGVAFQNRGGGTGYFDTVRVCVRRDSLILFSALSGVAGIKVSAAGAAGIITQSTYYAIFANRACVNIIPSLDFPGSNATVIGGMHSNCNLKVGGSNNTFAGLMTYAHALEVSGSNNHCNGSPCISDADSTPVIPMPINYTYDDVPCTYTGVSDLSSSPIYWEDPGAMTKLKPGVYCNAGGKITLGTGNVEGMITLVGAEVSLSGSDYNLTPYWNGVLAFATSGSPSAIDASGSNGSWTGIMYAPIGKVKIAGSSGLSIASSIIGDTVVLSGSNFSLQAAAGELPLTQIALIE